MSSLVLSDSLIRRIEKVAQERNLTPAELLERMLDAELEPSPDEYAGYATLADLAQNAREAGLRSEKPVDTSARVNEIMRTEFADYVRRKMEKSGNDTPDRQRG